MFHVKVCAGLNEGFALRVCGFDKIFLMQHDLNILKDGKALKKIFDANGNVCEDSVVACTRIISHDNVTIFFYDDKTIQIMVDNRVMYDLPLFSV